jgi:hypothetical protein
MKPKLYFYYGNYSSQFDDEKGGKYRHPEINVGLSYPDYRDRNKEVLPERWHSIINFKAQSHTGCRCRPYGMEITIKSSCIKEAAKFMAGLTRYFKRDYDISFLDVLEYLMKYKKAKRLDRKDESGHYMPCLYKAKKAKAKC